jgi:hypothetical protein
VGNYSTLLFLDSGANVDAINYNYYLNQFSSSTTLSEEIISIKDAGKNDLLVKGFCFIKVEIGLHSWENNKFYIIDKLPVDVLLGSTTMKKQGLDLINSEKVLKGRTTSKKVFTIPYHSQEVQVKPTNSTNVPKEFRIHLNEEVVLPAGCEQLVHVRIGKWPKEAQGLECLFTGMDNIKFPHMRGASGIATVLKGNSIMAIANLGLTVQKVPRGTMLGIAQQMSGKFISMIQHLPPEQPRTVGVDGFIRMISTTSTSLVKDDIPSERQIKDLINSYELDETLTNAITKKGLTLVQLEKVLKILKEYKDIFAMDPNNPGHVDPKVAEHDINVGTANPINQGPRRISPAQRRIVKETTDKLLAAGIISHSRSPWASPTLLVPKGDGWRMCIDYRKLNAVTKKEVYAIPRIDDVLDSLSNKVYFSTLDLASGYFQIPMAESAKEKTAFVTWDGQFQYNVMSFGLVNAPSTFQRCMNTVLAGLLWKSVQVYIDDIIISSLTFEDHISDLVEVFDRLRLANLSIKGSKCQFACSEVEYLGHLVSREGVRANPKKVELISDWDVPTTEANLHSFLGLAGYYRRLIQNFAAREAPLRRLLRKEVPFVMGPTEIAAFNDLKLCLSSDPVLTLPDFSGNSKFELHTDASDLGISAILTQIDPLGKEKVLQFASRMLTRNELKWHTQEKEALAIVWGCAKFRSYLVGTPFIIRSDHQSLQWLFRSEKGKLARWALSLSEFDFTIKHRAGKLNINADVASRWTQNPSEEESQWDIFSSNMSPPLLDPVINLITSNNDLKDSILQSQLDDPIFMEVRTLVQSNDHSNALAKLPRGYHRGLKSLLLKDNLLCRERQIFHKNQTVLQVLIPANAKMAQLMVLHHAHDNLTSGHMGFARTLFKIQAYYYWPNLSTKTKAYCKSCVACQLHKSKTPDQRNRPLKPSLPYAVNAKLGIDLITDLPNSQSGNKVGLVITDYFTKWAVVVPLQNKEAETVASAIFNHYYMIYGIPYEIQTDQGSEFTNDLLKRLNLRLSVGHNVTTPYYPQANGRVERFNQTLKNGLAIYAEESPSMWDCYMSSIAWSYNVSLHPVTGYSPFYLVFGREPRLPIDILQSSVKELKHDVEQYTLDMNLHLYNAYKIVKLKLEDYAKSMKKRWDCKIKVNKRFNCGDLVSMYKPQISTQPNEIPQAHVWKANWYGPIKVLSTPHENNPDVYVVEDLHSKRRFTVNGHKLKPFIAREYLTSLEKEKPVVSGDSLVEPLRDVDETIPLDVVTELPADPAQEDVRVLSKARQSKQEAFRAQKRVKDNSNPIEESLKEYIIDSILDHKKSRNSYSYLVKWKNYPPEFNTWEPSINLGSHNIALQRYWQDKPIGIIPRAYRKKNKTKNSNPNNSQ